MPESVFGVDLAMNCATTNVFFPNRHYNVLIVRSFWSLIKSKVRRSGRACETRQYQVFKANWAGFTRKSQEHCKQV